jgi:predicted dehydrogenase
MKTYRVAVIGCRERGGHAARAYDAHPRTEVVGLCDMVQERLDTLGDELGVSARYADLDAMIDEVKPDVVAIPTGTEFHFPLCMRVLEHGVDIDVEKPVTIDLEQADTLVARAKEVGSRIAVHHQQRVSPTLQATKAALDGGRIGRLRYIYVGGKGYYGGYGLMNIAVHSLNFVTKLAGPCRSVSATALTNGHSITPEDVVPSSGGMGTIAGENITALMEFDDNVTATLLQHRFPEVDGKGSVMEIYGTEGRLFWSNDGAWILPGPHFRPDGERDKWEPLETQVPDGYDPSSPAKMEEYCYVDEYVNALDEGREHESSVGEAHRVLEIMMGIFESAAYRRRVDLPQAGRDHPLRRWRSEHGLGEPEAMPRDYYEWLAAEDRRLGRG